MTVREEMEQLLETTAKLPEKARKSQYAHWKKEAEKSVKSLITAASNLESIFKHRDEPMSSDVQVAVQWVEQRAEETVRHTKNMANYSKPGSSARHPWD